MSVEAGGPCPPYEATYWQRIADASPQTALMNLACLRGVTRFTTNSSLQGYTVGVPGVPCWYRDALVLR